MQPIAEKFLLNDFTFTGRVISCSGLGGWEFVMGTGRGAQGMQVVQVVQVVQVTCNEAFNCVTLNAERLISNLLLSLTPFPSRPVPIAIGSSLHSLTPFPVSPRGGKASSNGCCCAICYVKHYNLYFFPILAEFSCSFTIFVPFGNMILSSLT